MKKPALVVLAAGMGSRYGGMKQLDPVGNHGQLIIDYSIYDAYRAGFDTVVFIIKKEFEELFRSAIGDRIASYMNVKYAYQRADDLPEGYRLPTDRVKPWGTAHAVMAARDVLNGPFAVINADDYYGVSAFRTVYDFLTTTQDDPRCHNYCLVGYLLKNTVTENGSVARGVCQADENGFLTSIVERTKVIKGDPNPKFSLDEGATWQELSPDTLVSMNLWGFHRSFLDESIEGFPGFLENAMANNPTKAEYFIPLVVERLLSEKKAAVRVLSSTDKWYGVTYKEDKPSVVEAIRRMTESGLYPDQLWV